MPTTKFFLLLLTCFSAVAVLAKAEGLREAKEAHKLAVASAVNEVAKEMSNAIQIALKDKDYSKVEEINRSLNDFLSNKDNPASLINISEIAGKYASKRKESARAVFQLYREEINSSRLASDPIKEEMDEFIKTETDAQRLRESESKEANRPSKPTEDMLSGPKESLPRKASKSPSEINPLGTSRSRQSDSTPTTKKSPSNKPADGVANQTNPSILTREKVEQMEKRILGIQEDYISKFDGATTDTQREKVAAAHRAAAIEQCFAATSSMYLVLDCELINSQAKTEGFSIEFKVTGSSLALKDFFSAMTVPRSFVKFAESSAGTKFRIKVPVAVVEGAKTARLQQWLSGLNYDLVIQFDESISRLLELPTSQTRALSSINSNSKHPLMNLSISLYAIWSFASIESDEIPDLPKYTPPNIPELGGSPRK
jgi:hypothetical protein